MKVLDIADKVNVNIDTISILENARRCVSLKVLYRYLDVLEITPDEFFLKGENFSVKDKNQNIEISVFLIFMIEYLSYKIYKMYLGIIRLILILNRFQRFLHF